MTPEETKIYLKEKSNSIDGAIKTILDTEGRYANNISPVAKEVLDIASEACFGGKRLRGTFVLTAAEMLGKDIDETTQQVAAITELIHSSILLFDDVVDDSRLRRNIKTVHYHYYEKYQEKPGAYLFGQGVAISMALILEHVVFAKTATLPLDGEIKAKLLTHLHRAFANTAYGELLDVYSFVFDNPTEEHILKVLDYKTARYTYEMPLHTGAILAGATDTELHILSEYAKYGGVAFQIIDDILGIYGDEEAIGKSTLSDLQEGKKTILMSHILQHGTPSHIERIKKHLGNKDVSHADLEEVKQILTDAGSLDYSRKMAQELMDKSNNIMQKQIGTWKKEPVEFLLGLNEFVLTRNT
jgi:geranylgeranyl diphosphate synthase type II